MYYYKMNNLVVIVLIIFVLLFAFNKKEGFLLLPPYWNVPTRNTRRGSYDIRGDPPLGVSPSGVGPWNISSDYYNNNRFYPYGRYWRPYRSRWNMRWW